MSRGSLAFDKYFDKVVVLNLPDKTDRLERCLKELRDKKLSKKVTVQQAIHGDSVGVSAWFEWGGGAWGCMMSHARIVQDFCMEFNYGENKETFKDRKLLIIEDDAIFADDASRRFNRFVKDIPSNWGQMYLGGQHMKTPLDIGKSIFKCASVNRTHAYGLSGRIAQHFHQHITYFPDYKGKNHHVDHQIEVAHRRGDWEVYGPKRWIAAQGENFSDINGRKHTNKWWDWVEKEKKDELPIILIDRPITDEIRNLLHCGYRLEDDNETMMDLKSFGTSPEFDKNIELVVSEACDQRVLAAVKCQSPKQEERLFHLRKGNLIKLSECQDLKTLISETYKK